jgi:TonB family protein
MCLEWYRFSLPSGIVFVRRRKPIIDEQGNIVEASIIKSFGLNECDEAAVAAFRSVKWRPAELEGIPVKIKIAIPLRIHFR